MTVKFLRWLWLLTLAANAACSPGGPPDRPQPNILVVLSDTHRADYVFVDPQQPSLTPNLARLAALGTLFTDAETVCPISAPSYASLFTAERPRTHGVLNNGQALGTDLPVLAEALHRAGYATSAVVANPHCSERFGFARGFDSFWDEVEGRGIWGRHVTDAAIAWLRNRPTDRPFFLFTAYMDAHKPYFYDDAEPSLEVCVNGDACTRLAAENRFVLHRLPVTLMPGDNTIELRFLTAGQTVLPEDGESPLLLAELGLTDTTAEVAPGSGLSPRSEPVPHFRMSNQARLDASNPGDEPLRTELLFRCHREYTKAETPSRYRDGVASFDIHLGRLFEFLETEGLYDDLAVVMLADHGEMLGEHQAWNHVSHVYAQTIDIPLIVRAPGFEPGAQSGQPLDLLDIHDLILGLAGADVGARPIVAPGARLRVAATYAPEAKTHLAAVQSGRYRLISDGSTRWELFDLTTDPAEAHNIFESLADDPEIRVLIDRVKVELDDIRDDELLDRSTLDDEELERLHALGYL